MEWITSVDPREYAPFYENYVSRALKRENLACGLCAAYIYESPRDALQSGLR